jgi:hypothetical protein
MIAATATDGAIGIGVLMLTLVFLGVAIGYLVHAVVRFVL